ncbi:MAG: hypothetical protein KA792_08000 [Bacteroidales bacterium]|nr:hypothetical protein [Bacteroidales bacterium]
MNPNRKKDFQENYFGKLPTVYIDTKYIKGKFVDCYTGKEIILKDNAYSRLETHAFNISDDDHERYTCTIIKEVIPAGTKLNIKMPLKNKGLYNLIVQLLEPLKMKKKDTNQLLFKDVNAKSLLSIILVMFFILLNLNPLLFIL